MKKVLSLMLSLCMIISVMQPFVAQAEDYDYHIEAEAYANSNWKSSGGARIQGNSDCSNGKYLNLYYPLDDIKEYFVEYDVDVKVAGTYSLEMGITPMSKGWSSPVNISVNGSEPIALRGSRLKVISSGRGINLYKAGTINLNEGSNKIKFIVNEAIDSGERAVCFFDYFGLRLSQYRLKEIKSPAPMQTFQQGETLKFEIVGEGDAPQNMNITYDVLDFEGNYVDGGKAIMKKGDRTTEFVLKSKKNGAYQILASCNGANVLQQFLVVTNLKDRKKLEDSPFGVDALMYGMRNDKSAALSEDFADLWELTGVTWTRDRLYFNNYVTKSGDKFTMSMPHTAKTGEMMAKRGIKVLMTMNEAPSVLKQDSYGVSMPTNLIDVYNFWKQLAEKYDGAVNCWEIHNEADMSGAFSNKDGADVYSAMFKAAALGIIDSNTKNEVFVAPQGTTTYMFPGHSSEYLELMLENDINDYTDITNYHWHQTARLPLSPYYAYNDKDKAGSFHELAASHGYTLVKWNSESGLSQDIPKERDYTAEEQMAQAKYLVTSFVEDLSRGTDKKFFFAGTSFQEGAKAWGMTSRSNTSPSAYASCGTLSAMTHVLGEGIYMGKVKNLPEGVSAYAFADGEETAIVYYSTSKSGEKFDFELDVEKKSVKYFDIFANQKRIYSSDGKYALTATDCPQYIKFTGRLNNSVLSSDNVDEYLPIGTTQKSVDDSKRVVLLQKYDLTARTNSRLDGYSLTEAVNGVDVEVFNFNDYPVNGDIVGKSANGWSIEPTSQPIEIAPMTSTTVHFDIIPDSFAAQEDRITFYGDLSCGTTSESVIKALGPKVVNIQPKINNGQKFINVSVTNASPYEKTLDFAKIILNEKESIFEEKIVICSGETKSFDVPTVFDAGDKTLSITSDLVFTDGTSCQYSKEIVFAIAKKDISSLRDTPAFVLPDDGNINSSLYYGEDDLYGEFYLGADENYLYFDAELKDNYHWAPNTGYNIWQNDGIQFSIGKGLPALGIPYYELGMSLTNSGMVETYYWMSPEKAGNGKLEGVDCKITRDEGTKTTNYHIAIPWEVIPSISYEDGAFSFSMIINENDGNGRNGYIEWGSGIGGTKNTSQFRAVVIEK